MMNNWFLLKIIPTPRLEYKNHTLFMSKWPKSDSIDTLFTTKLAEKPYPLGHTYIAHKRELPLGGSGHQTCTCPRNNFLIDFVGRFGNFMFVLAEIFQCCRVFGKWVRQFLSQYCAHLDLKTLNIRKLALFYSSPSSFS